MKKMIPLSRYIYFTFFFLFAILFVIILFHTINEIANRIEHPCHKLTIFVHGTMLPSPSFHALKHMFKTKSKRIYQNYLDALRLRGFFKQQPINKKGLVKIDYKPMKHLSKNYTPTTNIISLYHYIASFATAPDAHVTHSYYTFGWDGRLSTKNRRLWGKKLYNAITAEIQSIKKHNQNASIEITILTHSHGGNVALSMAEKANIQLSNFYIDRLILLGMPVQKETTPLITSPLFKKIYHFYSHDDLTQIIDVISTKTRSHHCFSKKRFSIPSNLVQVELIVGTKKPWHAELWFLKTKPSFTYRKNFPLKPFPISVFMPFIISLLEKERPQTQHLKLHLNKSDSTYKLTFFDKTNKKGINSKIFEKTVTLDLQQFTRKHMRKHNQYLSAKGYTQT